jgi:alanine racemase
VIRAVVDTAALRHNLSRVREIAPASRVLAVLKANAYGHGMVAVAGALASADGLAVARLTEAITLRAAGHSHRIVLLEGVQGADELDVAARNGFELVVHQPEQIALLEAWRGGHLFRIWLKIDTGMGRLGFRPGQLPAALKRLADCRTIVRPIALMTHLAEAERLDNERTRAQLECFGRVTAGLPGERSIANSAGLIGWPASRADWVRPGLMLYGISPFAGSTGVDLGLHPAMTLESRVIAVKELAAGDRVGYGGAWTARRATRIAVVAAGYGDGYMRNTANGTPVLVNAMQAVLAGRVSMDMLTIDVTDLPQVAIGDPVVLWGSGVPVETVAAAAGTIPYELICRVSERVHIDVR